MSKRSAPSVAVGRLNTFFNTLTDELLAVGPVRPGVARQVQRAKKRARLGNEKLRDEAISKFLAINEEVGVFQKTTPPSRNLDANVINNARHFITTVLERYTSTFDELSIQRPLELSYLFDHWRFGPGASNGTIGTHTAEKIGQDMTCTALCEPFVLQLRRTNPYFVARDSRNGVSGLSQIRGSRLSTVPKNEDTERTIAIEPSGNMCLQLAAGSYLEGALRYIGLDIRSQQPKNKAMALRGSIDGSVATIDLSAASDRVSIDLVRALMPRPWFDLLMKIRSPEIAVRENSKAEAKWVELQMISTMGNGFTFPLMTLLISALIYAYRCARGGPNLRIKWTDTCVFGDDIIVPSAEYDVCVETLTRAGFVVNHDKSFHEGPFRESCGGDYLNGVDITPFYVKSLANELDVYVAINQVLSWGGRENLFLPRTLACLRAMLRGKPHLVPEWLNPNQGVLTSGCPKRYTYLSLGLAEVELKDLTFAIPLISGGYIRSCRKEKSEGLGDALFYTPRASKPPKARVRRSRLPNGYLDGWDPLLRSRQVSYEVAARAAIIFGD